MSEKYSGQPGVEADVVLICDSLDIRLNPFVRRFIAETVSGMIRALDGVPAEPRTIELKIQKN